MQVEYVDDEGEVNTYTIEGLNSLSSVRSLRTKSAEASDIQTSKIVLVYKDQELLDARILGHYRIKNGSLIVMETI